MQRHDWSSANPKEPMSHLFISLHWLLVAARIQFKTLMLAYRTTTGSAPAYFHSLLRIYIPSRSPTYFHSLLRIYIPSRSPTYFHSLLRIYIPSRSPTYFHSLLRIYIPSRSPTYFHSVTNLHPLQKPHLLPLTVTNLHPLQKPHLLPLTVTNLHPLQKPHLLPLSYESTSPPEAPPTSTHCYESTSPPEVWDLRASDASWCHHREAQNHSPESFHSLFLAGGMIFPPSSRMLNPWQFSSDTWKLISSIITWLSLKKQKQKSFASLSLLSFP